MAAVELLHPGEMGSALGPALRANGHSVLWASAGRSPETAGRARKARLDDAASVEQLVERSDVILSVCPPHAATEVARSAAGFRGIYVDANAIAPATTRAIAASFDRFVDGGIIGPPPYESGTTRLYLSGAEAAEIARLFANTRLDARVLSDAPGDASALKMVYAAWTKGTAALLLAIRDVARAEGVDAALVDEWKLSIPELPERLRSDVRRRERLALGCRDGGDCRDVRGARHPRRLPPRCVRVFRRGN